jgi:Ni/Co efflux regulator RcnB
MKVRKAISIAIALSLTTVGFAIAQGDGDQKAQQRGLRQMQRQAQSGDQQGRRDGQRDSRQAQRGAEPGGHANNDQRRDEPGAGPDHQWHRGDRLPPEYNHRNYVVDDWRGHHLSAPPRGYHWVQSGNDYVLVAIASGIIAQLLLGNR